SASHNSYQDNGIKVFSPSGKKRADDTERRIEAEVARAFDDQTTAGDHERERRWLRDQSSSEDEYQHRYIDYLADEVGGGLSLDGFGLAIDCANGAASAIAPQLFHRLGARVEVISGSPDGRNINEACGSLHPERLQHLVVEQGLDMGIALDGDADRALF